MSIKSNRRSSHVLWLAACGVVAGGLLAGQASAAALYWDGGTTTQSANNAVDGGVGYWQNGLVNWTNVGGDTESAWANVPVNDAVFSVAPARVALNSNITVGNINFATPGYTIDLSRDLNSNSAGQPVFNLTASSLSGSSGTIQADSTFNTGTFTLDTPVSTTSTWSGTIGNVGSKMGFTKQGAGTFEYSGTLKTEYSNVNINGGTMKFVGAVNSSTNVFWNVNNSGTTLDLNGNTINGLDISTPARARRLHRPVP